jgi:hypothetical protein
MRPRREDQSGRLCRKTIGPFKFCKLLGQRVRQGLHVQQNIGAGDDAELEMVAIALQCDVRADPMREERSVAMRIAPINSRSRLF